MEKLIQLSDFLADKRGGYFVESGAGHAITGSATYDLEREKDWTGICVEPVEVFYQSLVKHRKCRIRKAALAPVSGKIPFAVATTDPWRSGILEFYNQPVRKDFDYQEVDAITIGDLLEQEQAPAIIDFWCLDTEGSELAILQSFPWHKYSIRQLCVEHNAYLVGPKRRDDIRSLLLSQGMTIKFDDVVNIYAEGF